MSSIVFNCTAVNDETNKNKLLILNVFGNILFYQSKLIFVFDSPSDSLSNRINFNENSNDVRFTNERLICILILVWFKFCI